MPNEEFAVYKIAIIGDVNVGKSSLIDRFSGGSGHISPTVYSDFHKVSIIEENKAIDLHIFDCSGEPKFRETSSHIYENVKGIVFVYDVTNQESYVNLQETWLKVADEFMEPDNHCPIFVVANKQDRPEEEIKVDKEEGERFSAAQSASGFFETSALTGQGVEKVFRTIADTMVSTWGGLHRTMSPETRKSIQTDQKEKKKKKKCKRIRRLFSCFKACCSRKPKRKKKKASETPPEEPPTPLPTVTHDDTKGGISEEQIKVKDKPSDEEDLRQSDEENQEEKPLRSNEDKEENDD